MRSDLIDPFHRALEARISEDRTNRILALASGSAKVHGPGETVAERYAAAVSYIHALEEVLKLCMELERERYGERPGADE